MSSVPGVGGGSQSAAGTVPPPPFDLSASDVGVSAAAASPAASASNLPTLANGDRGDDVRLLQESLSRVGYSPGQADGIFGDRTEAAVRAFQRDQGLTVDGVVGRGETWPALLDAVAVADRTAISPSLPVLANGDRGASVELLQESLNALGFDSGAADGIFGDRTEDAVRNFQRSEGLVDDGVVGRGETWPGLKSALYDRREQTLRDADAVGIGTPVGQALLRDADEMDSPDDAHRGHRIRRRQRRRRRPGAGGAGRDPQRQSRRRAPYRAHRQRRAAGRPDPGADRLRARHRDPRIPPRALHGGAVVGCPI